MKWTYHRMLQEDTVTDSDTLMARDLKIWGIFVVFVASCVGVLFPRIVKATFPTETDFLSTAPWLCLKSVSSGIVLSLAVIHLLPDAVLSLQEAIPEMEYPLGYAMCIVGIMINIGSELLAVACMNIVDDNKEQDGAYGTQLVEPAARVAAKSIDHEDHYCQHVHEHVHASHIITDTNSKTKLFMKFYIMECCIAIHSIIIGVAFGSMSGNELAEIRALMVAFVFHQFFEGISIGSAFCELSDVNQTLSFLLLSIFAITVPIGIIIGMFVKTSATGLIVSGIFNAIAAGSLIHNALVEMIDEDFSTIKKSSSFLKLAMFLSLCTGNLLMAVIAMWA